MRRALKRGAARNSTQQAVADQVKKYKEAKKCVRIAIIKSKADCWAELVRTVDKDPWGKPYKLVMRKLRGPSPTNQMEVEMIENVIHGLFPRRDVDSSPPVVLNQTSMTSPPFNMEELDMVMKRIKPRKKAPGPDGINTCILVAVYQCQPNWVLDLFNACVTNGIIPSDWKRARLVLLKKGDKPCNVPSSYRPLCLLNDIGKTLEFLLVRRLEEHIASKGGLSGNQFGFRRGKSTNDAAIKLRDIARSAVNRYEMCVAVSLDIQNAFNSIGWNHVIASLISWDTPSYLLKVFCSYFSERSAEIEGPEGENIQFPVECGVPQGSVVGPALWNLTYNAVLELDVQRDVNIIGFADDTLVVASGKTKEEVERKLKDTLCLVVGEIRKLGLTIAVHKTEAVMFKRKYKDPVPNIVVDDALIPLGKHIKYLGILVDEKLQFREHIKNAAAKAQRMLGSLSRVMPNIGGPRESRRRLLVSVVHSVLLYGAPVWAHTLEYVKTNIEELARVQRRAAIRTICAYCTVSRVAANVLASIPPIDMLALDRCAMFARRKEQEMGQRTEAQLAPEVTLRKWQERFRNAETGRWTATLIQDVEAWYRRRHGQLEFHMTQLFTGHGCFGTYLLRIGKETTAMCHHCNSEEDDDAGHTLFRCSAWSEVRSSVERRTGSINERTLVPTMLKGRMEWDAIAAFMKEVMKTKEEAERVRQSNVL